MASGASDDNPFPEGTLKLQAPYFKKLGFDFEKEIPNLRWGTLNVDIAPQNFKILKADYRFDNVNWIKTIAPETFSFVAVKVLYGDANYNGFIYYPHPETKPDFHNHNSSRLEIIAENIPDIQYGDMVDVFVDQDCLKIS